MSHEIIMFLPEVDGESAFVLFLHIGYTGDMEQHLTEAVLVNKTNTPIPLWSSRHVYRYTDASTAYRNRPRDNSLFFFSTKTSAAHQVLPTKQCICAKEEMFISLYIQTSFHPNFCTPALVFHKAQSLVSSCDDATMTNRLITGL